MMNDEKRVEGGLEVGDGEKRERGGGRKGRRLRGEEFDTPFWSLGGERGESGRWWESLLAPPGGAWRDAVLVESLQKCSQQDLRRDFLTLFQWLVDIE